MILGDKDGKPLMNAIVWLDNRAAKEAEDIKEKFGNKVVYDVTGQPEITATWPASKLIWVKENLPDVFEKTEKIFLLEDYILYRLTGAFVTEHTLQSSSLYFDIRNKCWWKEMLDFIGIDEGKLPKLCESSTVVGEYKGVKVVTGAMDQIAGRRQAAWPRRNPLGRNPPA
jgi:xylulokinase